MKLLKPLLIFYLIANGLAFSVFVARGTIVSWYVLEKTNSTLIVGLITSIPTMTLITLGPLGGRLADSFPREKIFFYALALKELTPAMQFTTLVIPQK